MQLPPFNLGPDVVAGKMKRSQRHVCYIVEGQHLAYFPRAAHPQRIATKVELREGGVEG